MVDMAWMMGSGLSGFHRGNGLPGQGHCGPGQFGYHRQCQQPMEIIMANEVANTPEGVAYAMFVKLQATWPELVKDKDKALGLLAECLHVVRTGKHTPKP
jgi:hypothetical protein